MSYKLLCPYCNGRKWFIYEKFKDYIMHKRYGSALSINENTRLDKKNVRKSEKNTKAKRKRIAKRYAKSIDKKSQ